MWFKLWFKLCLVQTESGTLLFILLTINACTSVAIYACTSVAAILHESHVYMYAQLWTVMIKQSCVLVWVLQVLYSNSLKDAGDKSGELAVWLQGGGGDEVIVTLHRGSLRTDSLPTAEVE